MACVPIQRLVLFSVHTYVHTSRGDTITQWRRHALVGEVATYEPSHKNVLVVT